MNITLNAIRFVLRNVQIRRNNNKNIINNIMIRIILFVISLTKHNIEFYLLI